MQKDERDLLEVLKFDLLEETVGSWLRAIIQCLEKQQAAIRRDQQRVPASSQETLRRASLYQNHHPKSAKPPRPAQLNQRRQSLPISSKRQGATRH